MRRPLRRPRLALRAGALACLLGCSAAPPEPASIGAILSRDSHTGSVHVHEAPPGLTGAEAGLQPGDRIKMIDGILVDELDAERIQELLRGREGTTVTLTVIRGEKVLDLEITRAPLGTEPAPQQRYQRIE